jgi:hypothetical protein
MTTGEYKTDLGGATYEVVGDGRRYPDPQPGPLADQDDEHYLTYARMAWLLVKPVSELTRDERMATDEYWDD